MSDAVEELRLFLHDQVSSFEELEALIFLMRAEQRAWSAAEVAAQLELRAELVEGALEALAGPGKLLRRVVDGGQLPAFLYAPRPDLRGVLSKLQTAYEEQRLTIVQIMSSNALERVRSSAARSLVGAFQPDRGKK